MIDLIIIITQKFKLKLVKIIFKIEEIPKKFKFKFTHTFLAHQMQVIMHMSN